MTRRTEVLFRRGLSGSPLYRPYEDRPVIDEASRQFLVLAADLGETGGIGTAMRDFVRVLVAEYGGEHCHVMSVRGGPGLDDLGADVIDPGTPTLGQAVPRRRQLEFTLAALGAARRYHRGLVVVAAHPHLAAVAWASALAGQARFVSWVFGKESWAPLPVIRRAALRRAALVLAISTFTARHAVKAQHLRPSRVRVVHLAISSRRTFVEGVERDPNAVLTVARLNLADAYKGVDTLLRVWPRVLDEVPSATLTVVGDGDARAQLEGLVNHSGIAGAIRFVGRISEDELNDMYRHAVLFALPGRCRMEEPIEGEGFGLVFVEAAAAGLPVVAGRAGGVTEVVLDGATGLLVDPEDDNDITAAIVRLLTDSALRDRLAVSSRSYANETFSFSRFEGSVLSALKAIR